MPGESFVPATKTWVTNPATHPQRVEWLRYEPESPVAEAVRQAPHICYTVDEADFDAIVAGADAVIHPFEAGEPPFGRAVFIEEDGIAVEYLHIYPGRTWFDDDTGEPSTP
jgi:hypothetical protein